MQRNLQNKLPKKDNGQKGNSFGPRTLYWLSKEKQPFHCRNKELLFPEVRYFDAMHFVILGKRLRQTLHNLLFLIFALLTKGP